MILDKINKLFTGIQRWGQGIPRGPAQLYDKAVSKYLEPEYKQVVDEVCSFKARKLVDIGCGPGKLLSLIASRISIDLMVGIDISYAMARIACRNFRRNGVMADVVNADAHMLPIRDGSIDLAVSTGTLHHIRRPEQVFRECMRILASRGEAWIYELSHDAPLKEIVEAAKQLHRPALLLKLSAVMHGIPRREYTEGFIRKALDRAGVKYFIEFRGILTKLIISKLL